MRIQLPDLLQSKKIPNLDDSQWQGLVEQIQAKDVEGSLLWVSYLSLRLHTQLKEGDLSAGKLIKKLCDASRKSCQGIQNEFNPMRQSFYRVWIVNQWTRNKKNIRNSEKSFLSEFCEMVLKDESLKPYAFSNSDWVKELLSDARQAIPINEAVNIEISAKIECIRSQVESGSCVFNQKDELEPSIRYGICQIPNRLDAILDSFCSKESNRERGVGEDGEPFHIRPVSDSPYMLLIGYTLARMDLKKYLQPVLESNWKTSDGLSEFIAMELVQAGRVPEAVALVTGKGTAEALKAENKEAFDRANCLLATLKREREYTYSRVFKSLCACLPELVPNKNNLDEALNSLEKTVLADPFWENPDLHQGESLIALAGAMLRCGEFDRAQRLIEKCIGKFGLKSDDEWSLVRIQYLDAACYWFLNGKPDLMIQMLGDYLHLRSR